MINKNKLCSQNNVHAFFSKNMEHTESISVSEVKKLSVSNISQIANQVFIKVVK